MGDLYNELRPIVDEAAERVEGRHVSGDDVMRAAAAAAARGAVAGSGSRRNDNGSISSGSARRVGSGEGAGGGCASRRNGWAAQHHLSSAELEELSLLRAAEGLEDGGGTGGSDQEDLSADEGTVPDLGDISVAEDGSILTPGSGNGSGSGGGDAAEVAGEGGGGGDRAAAPLPMGPLRVALMGAPNAGKSTMLNSLLGWERSLTGECARGAWLQGFLGP
jgi:hypothetical protein